MNSVSGLLPISFQQEMLYTTTCGRPAHTARKRRTPTGPRGFDSVEPFQGAVAKQTVNENLSLAGFRMQLNVSRRTNQSV